MASAQLIAAHRAEIVLADLGLIGAQASSRSGSGDAVARGGDCHALQVGADLVAKPARAAVDHHHDVALVQAEHCGNLRVEDLGRLLHFEVMVSLPSVPISSR